EIIPEYEKLCAALALKQVLLSPILSPVSRPAATVNFPRAGLIQMVAGELYAADHIAGDTLSCAAPHKVFAIGNQGVVEDLAALRCNRKDCLTVRIDVVELGDLTVDDEKIFTLPVHAATIVLRGQSVNVGAIDTNELGQIGCTSSNILVEVYVAVNYRTPRRVGSSSWINGGLHSDDANMVRTGCSLDRTVVLGVGDHFEHVAGVGWNDALAFRQARVSRRPDDDPVLVGIGRKCERASKA